MAKEVIPKEIQQEILDTLIRNSIALEKGAPAFKNLYKINYELWRKRRKLNDNYTLHIRWDYQVYALANGVGAIMGFMLILIFRKLFSRN